MTQEIYCQQKPQEDINVLTIPLGHFLTALGFLGLTL